MNFALQIAVALTAIAGLATTGFETTTAAQAAYKVETTRLGPWDTDMLDFAISSDGRHFAYTSSHKCRKAARCVVLDGNVVEEAENIREGGLAISPDGKHIAYAAKKDNQWTLIVDGKPNGAYDLIEMASPVFSPDSNRIAFVAKVGGRYSVVVDGQIGPGYDGIANPALLFRMIADKGEMPGGETAGGVAGAIMMGLFAKVWYMAIDPVTYDLYKNENRPAPVFSPDSKRVAYVAKNDKRWVVVVDGQAGPEFDRISGFPIFGPDSKHFAYTGVLNKKNKLVVDGKEIGADYEQSAQPAFSPDGTRLAYLADQGKESFVVLDGQPCAGVGGFVGGPVAFSPDGKHLTYIAGKRKKTSFMVDGQAVADYVGFNQLLYSPQISPDGKRMAYVNDLSRGEGSKKEVVVDGQIVSKNYGFGEPIFSPDSKHVAFISRSAFGATTLEVDGTSVEGREDIINGSLVFDPDGSIEFLSVRKEPGLDLGLYRAKYIPNH